MKKRNTWIGTVLAAGMALALLAPANAQSTETTRGDSQKPVVSTYDKKPDSSGKNQSLDAATYNKKTTTKSKTESDNAETYNKKPDPTGENQKLDSVRYDEENEDNQGPVSQVTNPEESKRGDTQKSVVPTYNGTPPAQTDNRVMEPERGDTQKPVVPTYDGVPPAQSTMERPRTNDVSEVEEPKIGDDQKPVVPTYDKRPDPKGDAQKLDAVRYDEQNNANDGKSSELRMREVKSGEKK